jgi:putative tricarboxylic transport membrane protein
MPRRRPKSDDLTREISMVSKKALDLKFSLVLLGTAILVMVESYEISLGDLHEPGPGFLPFYGALIMGVLIGINIIHLSYLRREKEPAFSSYKNLKILIYAFTLTFLAIFFFESLGFVITATLYLIFLLKLVGRVGWVKTLFVSILIVAFSYLIFVVFLKVQLPPGLLRM